MEVFGAESGEGVNPLGPGGGAWGQTHLRLWSQLLLASASTTGLWVKDPLDSYFEWREKLQSRRLLQGPQPMMVDEAQTCERSRTFSQYCLLQDHPRGTCLLPVNFLGGQLCRWGSPPRVRSRRGAALPLSEGAEESMSAGERGAARAAVGVRPEGKRGKWGQG